jgi:hypothetical protein
LTGFVERYAAVVAERDMEALHNDMRRAIIAAKVLRVN